MAPPSGQAGLRKRKSENKALANAKKLRKTPSNKGSSTANLAYAFLFIAVFVVLFFREPIQHAIIHFSQVSMALGVHYAKSFVSLNRWYLKEFLGLNELERIEFERKYPRLEHKWEADVEKRDQVKEAFKGAWLSYERNAMGSDEFHPISEKGTNLTTGGGIGYTIIDAMDTMKLMGLEEEFGRARKWVVDKLDFEQHGNYSVFECTIRVLGGLLAAHHLNGNDPVFLEKAVDLADRLLPAFNTPSGLPMSSIDLASREPIDTSEFPGTISTAEATTLQLEFKYLSHLTQKKVYWETAERVMAQVQEHTLDHGLASVWMSWKTGEFLPSTIRLGSRADSHWEYLLKQYLQTNMHEPVYKRMYDSAMNAIHRTLVTRSQKARLTYVSEISPQNEKQWLKQPRQEHLVCFFGGSLMLGAVTSGKAEGVEEVSIPPRPGELTEEGERDWNTGKELIQTCLATHDTSTGLPPEVVWFRIDGDGGDQAEYAPGDWYIRGAEPHLPVPYEARYLLRPETLESLYIAYTLTGSQEYRDAAWKIFKALQAHCRVPTGGYASIVNVDDQRRPVEKEDKSESYLLSETLKYLFLIFQGGRGGGIDLEKYVLNTEAHPLPRFDPEPLSYN